MQIIAFTCRCFVYQEHLGVLTATCAAYKRLPLRTSAIRRRRLSQWGRPRFYKRGINQYPARLSGGLQSPTEINAPRGCAGIRFGRYQLTLTRIPRQFSRARIELSGGLQPPLRLVCWGCRIKQKKCINIHEGTSTAPVL